MRKKGFQADRVLSYFKAEWKVLLIVAVSGMIYNLGLLAGPWFEGKMTGTLVQILKGMAYFSDRICGSDCRGADFQIYQKILRQKICK